MGNNQIHLTCPRCRQASAYKMIPFAGATEPATTGAAYEFHSAFETLGGPEMVSRHAPASFWHSDGTTYAVAGLTGFAFVWLACWWYDLPFALAPLTGIATGLGLHVAKIILHAPPKLPGSDVKETVIKVEHWSEDNQHVLLNDLDARIELGELQKVARAVVLDGCNFSRPALTKAANISQGKYSIINDDFRRLNFAFTTKANKTTLTPRAMAFLRKVASLPYPYTP